MKLIDGIVKSVEKVAKNNRASAPCNSVVMKVLASVKPKLFELAEAADQIDAWLSILAPKIEDGNNLGVQVQVDEVNNFLGRI